MLHPSKFFEWCEIRTEIDVFEIFDDTLKKKMMSIHPKNFIKSKLELPVYKVSVGYETEKGNYKETEKYMILNNTGEQEYELGRSAYGFEIDRNFYQRAKDEMLNFEKREQYIYRRFMTGGDNFGM